MGTLTKALWRYGPTTRPSPQCSYLSQFNHGYNEVNNTFVRFLVWIRIKRLCVEDLKGFGIAFLSIYRIMRDISLEKYQKMAKLVL